MNKFVRFICAGVVILGMSVAMAEPTPAEVYADCKKDAATAEVPAADQADYIRKCMEDNGVDAADIDSSMKGK